MFNTNKNKILLKGTVKHQVYEKIVVKNFIEKLKNKCSFIIFTEIGKPLELKNKTPEISKSM